MLEISRINIAVVLMFGMLSYANNVIAMNCYEKSPNLINLHDGYYNMEDAKTLSDKDKAMLNDLFRNIEGKWKGESINTECKGPDRAPRKEYKNSTIDVDMRLNSDGNLRIIAEMYYPKEKIIKHKTLSLLDDLNIFEFKASGDNGLVFSERQRRANVNKTSRLTANVNKTSRLTETIYEIKLNLKSLLFARYYYVNGVFVGAEKWSMTRD